MCTFEGGSALPYIQWNLPMRTCFNRYFIGVIEILEESSLCLYEKRSHIVSILQATFLINVLTTLVKLLV
jgi:hypothetical protein